jgi:Tol biopolymer transport system component
MKRVQRICAGAIVVLAISGCLVAPQAPQLGVFEAQGDIGDTRIAGDAVFDSAAGIYRLSGGGANMWAGADAFHFAWKRAAGDLSVAADVSWVRPGGNPHRKAGVMIRQSLAPDAPYADLVVHGNGLVSLQYREAPGGETHEIQANVSAPHRIRLEREGDYVTMSFGGADGALHTGGGNFRLKLAGPYYVGLVVCAHDNAVSETARFANVEIAPIVPAPAGATPVLESTLETIDLNLGNRKVIYHTGDHIEAPNWSRDGGYFIFNRDGGLYRLAVEGGTPVRLDTGPLHHMNNDHGMSPDGTLIAVSDQTRADNQSRVNLLPIGGGTPREVTELGPSYWHGWSPDGKTLAIVARRNGDFDIYAVPARGGAETRLTTAVGLDDGPDYSPDGKWIYFNSVRSGNMKIWRMHPDGSGQEQVTFGDAYRDWFPHPSPDGKWLVFISFGTDVDPGEHPANKDVTIRIMPVSGGEPRVLTKLFGGQGTLNVSSWSPDSSHLAFVSYRLVH